MLPFVLLSALLMFTGLTLLRPIFVELVEYGPARLWSRTSRRVQTITTLCFGAGGIVLGLAMLVPEALAAEGGYTIDLAPALGPLGELLITAVVVIGTWGLRRLLTYLGMREDDRARELLETAFYNGLNHALEMALRAGLDAARVETRHQLIAEGARYVVAAVPDALDRFKLDENAVRARLTARLGMVAPMPNAPKGSVGFLAGTSS